MIAAFGGAYPSSGGPGERLGDAYPMLVHRAAQRSYPEDG
jgi:hypothetical protein